MKVKQIILCALTFFAAQTIQGQVNISGKIIYDQKPLSDVNVLVLKEDSGFAASAETDSTGTYTISNIRAGSYKIVFSLIGYNKETLFIKTASEDLKMPDIIMKMETVEMNEVTVQSKRSAFKLEPGKTTVTLSAASLGSNGSLLSILEKIPGILILSDGSVILNGQTGANVMIDGKQSYLSGENLLNMLRSMSGSTVDKIEMVSNPSSQYDAAGPAGFINIKSKKKREEGVNLNLASNIEAGKRIRQNQNFSLQLDGEKYTFFTNYSFRSGQDYILVNSYREYLRTKTADTSAAVLNMDADRKFSSNSHYLKTGIEYRFSENLNLSTDVYRNWFKRNKDEAVLSELFQGSGFRDFSLYTDNEQNSNHESLGGGIRIVYKFSPKIKWENLFNFLVFEQNEKLDQESSISNTSEPDSEKELRGRMGGTIQITNLQSDFSWDTDEKFVFYSGLKGSSIAIDNNAIYNILQPSGWIEDEKLSSNFFYKEKVLAAYLQTEQKWSERFSTKAGLRLELTDTEGRYVSGGRDSTVVRNYQQLFPAFSASYNITDKYTVGLQYGRRIVRPNYRDLSPFTEVNDRYLQERGNTALRPELINNIELSWLVKQQYTLSMFYNTRKNPISKSYLTESESDITIVTPLNLTKSYALGIKAGVNNISPMNWWTLHLNGSLTYKKFQWQEMGILYTNSLLTPVLQFNNQFKLPGKWAFEATGYYSGAMAEGQAEIGTIGSVSFGARKNFFENKLSLYAYINDVFLTNIQNIRLYNSLIAGFYKERRDSRMAGITISWRFDSGNSSKAMRKIENMEESKRIN